MGEKAAEKPQESLGYVAVPQQAPTPPENFRDKFIRKTSENPLVPIGA